MTGSSIGPYMLSDNPDEDVDNDGCNDDPRIHPDFGTRQWWEPGEVTS